MFYFFFTLATLTLLAAFLFLTSYEARRGARFFAPERTRFDQNVEHITFVLTHVDFGMFLRGELRRVVGRISHDIAHFSLQVVRTTERLLTRLVRYLRSRYAAHTVPGENVREFVKTLSDFKVKLKETRPDVTEVQ